MALLGFDPPAEMSSTDLYSDGIEVSNACRRFYVSRLQAAEALKVRLAASAEQSDNENGNGTLKKSPDRGNGRMAQSGAKTDSFQTVLAQLRSELVGQLVE